MSRHCSLKLVHLSRLWSANSASFSMMFNRRQCRLIVDSVGLRGRGQKGINAGGAASRQNGIKKIGSWCVFGWWYRRGGLFLVIKYSRLSGILHGAPGGTYSKSGTDSLLVGTLYSIHLFHSHFM